MTTVGSSPIRVDAREKVTGLSRFIDDYSLPGMLHGRVFRSPVPHCRIRKLDVAAARRFKGVAAVVTAKDLPGKNIVPLIFKDMPLLAERAARYLGEPIALIAAEDAETAEKAARAIKLDYEELPPIDDPLRATEPETPRIYGEDNVFKSYRIRKGDPETAWAACDVIAEGEYVTGYQEHAYLETQGVIATPEIDGEVVVMGSMQCPFYVREAVSMILGLQLNRVRIRQTVTGGGFGGKEDVPSWVASQAAAMAVAAGRPVKLIYDRREDITVTSKRHPSWSRLKLGAKKDGTLIAAQVEYVLDSGAYATLSPVVLWRGTVHAAGPYLIPNVGIDSRAVATTKVPCGAFRGFGSPQIIFAIESLLDELAEKLEMDPLELRIKNALKLGDATATGHILTESVGLVETLEKARAAAGWDGKWKPANGKTGRIRTGVGVSANFYGVGLGAEGKHMERAGAEVHVMADGSVTVSVGNTEMGQGALTVMAQIAAEALGAELADVYVGHVDTARVPDSGPTVASRTTVMSGKAVLDACERISPDLFRTAAEMLGIPPEEMGKAPGRFFRESSPEKSVSYREAVAECHRRKLQMSAQGWFVAPDTTFEKDGLGDAYFVYSFAANIVEVEVDLETGVVDVKRIIGAHDLGKAINPAMAEGQIEGGALQGMGYAIMENMVSEKGRIQSDSLTTYPIPTSLDAPEIVPILVEHPYSHGPFGAKGLGEPPLMGVAPAVINAVSNAVGVRFSRIPLMPEEILRAAATGGKL